MQTETIHSNFLQKGDRFIIFDDLVCVVVATELAFGYTRIFGYFENNPAKTPMRLLGTGSLVEKLITIQETQLS